MVSEKRSQVKGQLGQVGSFVSSGMTASPSRASRGTRSAICSPGLRPASTSRLTTSGSDRVIEQITKQLNKLIEVVKLVDLSEGAHIERELMLVKLKATGAQRAEIKRTTDIFRGQIVDVTPSVYTVQLAGASDKLDAYLEAVGDASILEVVRSGVSGIARGDKILAL